MNSVCSKVWELLDNFASQENVSVFLQCRRTLWDFFFFLTLVPPADNLLIRLTAPCEILLGVGSNFLCRISESAGPCKVCASHAKLLPCNFPRSQGLVCICCSLPRLSSWVSPCATQTHTLLLFLTHVHRVFSSYLWLHNSQSF